MCACAAAAEETNRQAHTRIHVERAIGRLKNWGITRNQMKVTQFRLIGDIYYVCIGLMAFTEGPIGPKELIPQAKEACGRQAFVTQAEYVHLKHVPADARQQSSVATQIVNEMQRRFESHTGDVSALMAGPTPMQIDSDYGLSEAENEYTVLDTDNEHD